MSVKLNADYHSLARSPNLLVQISVKVITTKSLEKLVITNELTPSPDSSQLFFALLVPGLEPRTPAELALAWDREQGEAPR